MTSNLRLLERQQWQHFTSPLSYIKSVQWQKEYALDGKTFLCDCDATIKFWEDDHDYPSLEYLWPIEAFDIAGHQVINLDTLANLHAVVKQWMEEDNYEQLVEQIRRQGV